MADTMLHRGPDAHGEWQHANLALAHRRLSIIDTSSGGAQPMKSSRCGNHIVFNGEIYNYIEVRQELRACGYNFHSDSDTEVILAAYEHWGQDCVQHFNGVWAFAIYDSRQDLLFCSRDRMGEKPFFYSIYDDSFVFASEIKALFAYGVPKRINSDVLDAYLCFSYVPAPHSFYQDILKLKAGHNLIIQNGSLKIVQYWDVPLIELKDQRHDEDAIIEEFNELFNDSVRLRMRSDVPFGAFLSGGLDSASVVAAMSLSSNETIRTFTAGFDDAEFDERSLAALVAERYHTDHTSFSIGVEESELGMQALDAVYDEPFGDSSALPSMLVAAHARKHVTVVLTGDGGDEVLGGYTIHQGEKFAHHYRHVPSLVAQHLLPASARLARRVAPASMKNKFLRIEDVLRSSAQTFRARLLSKQIGFRDDERHELLTGAQRVRAEDFIADALAPVQHMDTFSQLNYWLTKVSLVDDMLTKVDRATMSQSLEARLPFLDHRIVELMWSVSMNTRLKGFTRKYILRKAMESRLPAELFRAPKRGFVLPIRNWYRNGQDAELRRRIQTVASSGLVRSSAIPGLIASHQRGDRNSAQALWTLGMVSTAINEHSIHSQESLV